MNFFGFFFTLLAAAPVFSIPVPDNSVAAPENSSDNPPYDGYDFEPIKRDSTTSINEDIVSLMRNFDAQIDSLIPLVSSMVSSTIGSVTQEAGKTFLEPFVETFSNKLDKVIIPQITNGAQSVDSTITNQFIDSTIKLANLAQPFGINTSGLQSSINKIKSTQPKTAKRDGLGGVFGVVSTAQQVQHELNAQFVNKAINDTATINNFIKIFETETKNVVAAVTTVFQTFVGNLGKHIGSVLTNPFLQLATQGAENLLNQLQAFQANAAGIDQAALAALLNGFNDIISLGRKSGLDVNGLSQLNQELKNYIAKLN